MNPTNSEVISNASYSQPYARSERSEVNANEDYGAKHHVVISASTASSHAEGEDLDETMTMKKRERPATPRQPTKEEQERKRREEEENRRKEKEKEQEKQRNKEERESYIQSSTKKSDISGNDSGTSSRSQEEETIKDT